MTESHTNEKNASEPRTDAGTARSVVGGGAVARYDLLEGGAGREVNFRPPRYPSADLGPVGATIEVTLGEQRHSCELHDVSQNGVGFEWQGPSFQIDDVISQLVVRFDQHEAYRGAARVGSVREVGGKVIVGASFMDTLMNIDDVLQLRDVKSWRNADQDLSLKDRPWRIKGYDPLKALMAELRLFFMDAEQQLNTLEASLPWHVVHGDHESPARSALIARIEAEVVSEIVEYYTSLGRHMHEVPLVDQGALKEFSLRHLHTYFMQSPWVRRAREKPLGYPGDYELMNGLYGNHFAGNTLFAKAVNLAFVTVPAAAAVRERKNLIRDRLIDLARTARPVDRPIRILSIAAGPAQETYEMLEMLQVVEHPIEIVLFDQDKRALAFAYTRLARLVASKWEGRVQVVYLHDTIKRLLRDPLLFAPLGEFDAVFSCGLFDYLPQSTAATLTSSLFMRVASGGKLYIGNQTPRSTSRWAMEFHCDWNLIYRTHAEMMDFAQKGSPDGQPVIVEESTGINPFVMLTRA